MNEALFREVNERIEKLQDDLGQRRQLRDRVRVRRRRVARSASRSRTTPIAASASDVHRFAVIPGHELPDVERTVARATGYLVVEKTDPDAAQGRRGDWPELASASSRTLR